MDEVLQKNLLKDFLYEKADDKDNYVDSENEEDYYWEDDSQDSEATWTMRHSVSPFSLMKF